MFPEDVSEYIENEQLINETIIPVFNGKSFLFDFETGDFIYLNKSPVEVSGIAALQIWIEKIIRTEKQRFRIYENTNYGVSIEDLIGHIHPIGFAESELKRELTESILLNPVVEELTDWIFVINGSEWKVSFTVVTIEDEFAMELTI